MRGPLKYYRHGDDVETPRAFKKENQILSLSLLTVQPFNTQNHLPLKNIFSDKYNSEELKGEVYKALILPTLLYFTVVKLGPCVKIYLSAFEVSITGVLVAFAV